MLWVGITLVTLTVVELVLRLKLIALARRNIATSSRAMQVLSSKGISDHWKEKAMLGYAGRMLALSLRLALGFVVIVIIAAGILFLFESLGIRVYDTLFSWSGILGACLVSLVYLTLRKRLGSR